MSKGKPRHSDTAAVQAGDLSQAITVLRDIVGEARDVIREGRILQRDLRADIRIYRELVDRRVEDLFEERVHAAIEESFRILNIAVDDAHKQVIASFRVLRAQILDRRSDAELEIIGKYLGDTFAISDAIRGGNATITAMIRQTVGDSTTSINVREAQEVTDSTIRQQRL